MTGPIAWITCPKCGWVSHHLKDVQERYCGHCHQFHDQMEAAAMSDPPAHPFWCDYCGRKAGFTIKGCPIEHAATCPRRGEDPMAVFDRAKAYCQRTGKAIP